MNNRVVLINSPRKLSRIPSRKRKCDLTYSLGIMYVASMLRKHDFDVRILDLDYYQLSSEDVVKKIKYCNPFLLGMNVTFPNLSEVLRIAKKIKEEIDLPIILGGPAASLIDQYLIKDLNINFVIRKEGEITTLELAKVFRERCFNFEYIDGLTWIKGGKVVRNRDRDFIKNLDSLPFPDINDVPTDLVEKSREINIITSRGCPFECIYCSTPKIYNRSYRRRSCENVIEEIKTCKEKLSKRNVKIRLVHFLDDNFTINKEWLHGFIEKWIGKGYHREFSWRCISRVDTLDKKDLLLMKRSGCCHISYGAESGSDRILSFIKKRITIERIRETLKFTYETGIKSKCYFMIGFPTETRKEIEQTIQFAANLPTNSVSFNIVKPYLGTELWEKFGKEYIKRYSEKTGKQFNLVNAFSQIDMKDEDSGQVRQSLSKYGSVPSLSCNENISTEKLIEYCKKGYKMFLENCKKSTEREFYIE